MGVLSFHVGPREGTRASDPGLSICYYLLLLIYVFVCLV